MKISRRNFLKGSATTLFLAGFNFPILANASKKKNLVVIMLRGGMDGLCAVPIIGDKNFEKKRKDLILDETIKLNSDFALHPKLMNFYNLWQNNLGAIVHATNIPYTKRSHFDGQNMMETGALKPYIEKTGWLGRGMKSAGLYETSLALSLPMPLLLRGAIDNNNYFPTHLQLPNRDLIKIVTEAYGDFKKDDLGNVYDVILNRPLTMQGGNDSLDSLSKRAAKILNDPFGPRVAVFDLEGFDTHTAQGNENGEHADNLQDIDLIVKNLYQDMGKSFNNTLIITLTEFGRTIEQNGGNGTEHGYGGAILMAGGLLKRSQVLTDWPGLKKSSLFEGRDLNSTIDARSIYASAMSCVFDTDFEKIIRVVFWDQDI